MVWAGGKDGAEVKEAEYQVEDFGHIDEELFRRAEHTLLQVSFDFVNPHY